MTLELIIAVVCQWLLVWLATYHNIYHLQVFFAVDRLLCYWPVLFVRTHNSCMYCKVGTGLYSLVSHLKVCIGSCGLTFGPEFDRIGYEGAMLPFEVCW